MPLQHVAFRFVQPRDHDQFVTDFHSQQCIGEARFDLEPRVGRTFRSLSRRVCTALDCRSDKANRLECVSAHVSNVVHAFHDATSHRASPISTPARESIRSWMLDVERWTFAARPIFYFSLPGLW